MQVGLLPEAPLNLDFSLCLVPLSHGQSRIQNLNSKIILTSTKGKHHEARPPIPEPAPLPKGLQGQLAIQASSDREAHRISPHARRPGGQGGVTHETAAGIRDIPLLEWKAELFPVSISRG